MEIISSIATKISEYAIGAIIHQFGYLVYYNDNIKGLKEQVEILVSARSRMHHLIDEAKHKAEDIEDDVCLWLTKVDEIVEEAYNFLINVGEEKAKNCSNASCFNLVQRHRLSRKAKKMANELTRIQEQGKIDKVSYHGPLQGIESTVPGYLTFESRMSIIEEIMKALQDPHINIIGVYGMGGIGKTMLVKAISCQLKKSKLFEPIIMVIVGQNPDVTHIQGLLGDMLNLSFGQETKEGRAALLRKRLQREKKILIIIDDIWSGLDFESIGIPSNDDNEGRKILVTSRSQHVLFNTMGIEKNFEVKDLTREESWKFFKQMVDESIESNRELNKIAMEVANKCGKLPIALVIVAKALKGKHLHTWRDALRQLKNPTIVDIEGVSKEVYASLKLSYDNLNSREAKLLFLLCSIFPDDYDIDIDELSRYTMGLKFLQDADTLLTARDKILTLVDYLESSCLLQKSGNNWDDKPSVKMHDVVRDVAIYIASKDDRMCTLSYGKGLSKWQDEKTHGHYNAIFANCVNFQGLPEKLSFPRLELLALVNKPYRKMDLFRIPTGCLEGMEKLKVLHLEQIRFSLPPMSSNYLVNLRTLLLIRCRLGNIDNIGELKNLEILDFSSSDITELPLSTRQLSRLKQLRVSYCNQLEVIPPGVISRLTKLEELYLDHSFGRWEVEGFNYSQKKNASLSELDNLSSLTSITLSIPNVRYLPERAFLNNTELECFQIVIGRDRYNVDRGTYKKILDIKTNSRNVLLKEGVNRLLNKSENLSLDATNGVKNVVFELYRSVSPNLRYLTLQNNEDVKYLVSEFDEKLSCKGFSVLESLILRNMRGLETIIQGYCSMKTVNVFTNLKIIVVANCNKMKYLFSFSSIKGLLNLEEIHVWECDMMEAIVVMENEAIIDKIEFKKLKTLWLFSLPQLKSFCGKAKGKELIQSQSHEIVEEEDTYSSITPFDCKIAFPNLRTVYIKVKNIWDDLLIASNLNKLERIDLNECEVLKSVFAGETIRNIEELQILHIRNCDLLEEVFRIQKLNNVNNDDTFAFSSKLDWLILQNIPNLKQVWRKDPDGILISFQCLRRVEFDQCPELKRVFPAYLINHLQQLEVLSIIDCGIDEIFESEFEITKVSFPKLRSLEIKDIDNLEIIWHNKLTVHNMSNLQFVKLDNCKSLKGIFTSNVMRVLKKFKELCVQNCDSVEEVFEINPTIKSEEENLEVATITLKKLQLRNLRSLKHVWSNDPYGLYHFENLYDVEIIGCPKLITMVPPSLARDFSYHLQRLHVDDSMDEIFMKKETSKTKALEGEVKFYQDSFIKLTEMELDGKKRIRELCHPNFSKELFPLLKVLKLKDMDDYEMAPFPLEFHQLLYGLEELQVHKAFLVEIFSYDDKTVTDEKCQSRTYSATLKKLYLTELPKLLHIWKEDSHTVQPSFDNLEVVRVENCNRLSTPVMPSSFSFQNLKKLAIYKCHGLSHLLDRSVAKTLVRLKKMKLSECKSMTTILGYREDEGGEDDEIVFSELEVLKLYDLPKLKMFQLAKCIIKFPYLKTLATEKCPEMKMFSPGLVCTPLLKSITDVPMSTYGFSRKKPNKFWAGSINATIRQLWEDGYDHSIHELFKEENIEPN